MDSGGEIETICGRERAVGFAFCVGFFFFFGILRKSNSYYGVLLIIWLKWCSF